jgi:hypothetical protein
VFIFEEKIICCRQTSFFLTLYIIFTYKQNSSWKSTFLLRNDRTMKDFTLCVNKLARQVSDIEDKFFFSKKLFYPLSAWAKVIRQITSQRQFRGMHEGPIPLITFWCKKPPYYYQLRNQIEI